MVAEFLLRAKTRDNGVRTQLNERKSLWPGHFYRFIVSSFVRVCSKVLPSTQSVDEFLDAICLNAILIRNKNDFVLDDVEKRVRKKD